MKFILTLLILFSTLAYADAGYVIKKIGQKEGHLLRQGEKRSLEVRQVLKMGDEIFSQESMVLIYLEPNLQISLSKNSHIKLNRSLINLMKGLVRVRVEKVIDKENDFKLQTRDVVVAISEAEFEIMIAESKNVELDVFNGEVVVSSPHVHSFVPEVVKSREGLTFHFVKKAFLRRKIESRFKNYPKFLNRSELNNKKR
jgi:hypothetical protein